MCTDAGETTKTSPVAPHKTLADLKMDYAWQKACAQRNADLISFSAIESLWSADSFLSVALAVSSALAENSCILAC